MTRSALAAIVLLAATGNAFAQSVDAPPTQPGNFRATLYDKAGGELFWQRSTDDRGAVRGYEITRNGESLGIRDALSYYDPSLQPNTPYTFTVVAIDNTGQRSSAATTTLGGGTAPPSPSDGPDAPDALRSDVYSRTAAELFWRREPAALALRYEVRRDGQVVGTTNGVSYYTNALQGGTDYAFEIIAIDRGGRRSSPSRITVRTTGDGPPTPSALAAPANLSADVYSRTAAELFWDRAATPGLRYEVARDGEIVGTTNGTSFYDDALSGDTSYRYDVVTIDPTGRRSTASSVMLETEGGRFEMAIINAQNVGDLVDAAIDVMTGRGYTSELLAIRTLPAEFGFDPMLPPDDFDEMSAVCDNGGTVLLSGSAFPLFPNLNYVFDGCQLDTAVFDGRLRSSRSFGGNFSRELTGEDLTVDLQNSTISLDGRVDYSGYRIGGINLQFSGNLELPLKTASLVLEEASFALDCRFNDPLTLSGSFAFTSAETNGDTIDVETTTRFEETGRVTNVLGQGRMTLTAADGSVAVVEVENGDATTYDVTVTNGGRSDTFTRSLDELFERTNGDDDLGCE